MDWDVKQENILRKFGVTFPVGRRHRGSSLSMESQHLGDVHPNAVLSITWDVAESRAIPVESNDSNRG
jgi:hypothetical protein